MLQPDLSYPAWLLSSFGDTVKNEKLIYGHIRTSNHEVKNERKHSKSKAYILTSRDLTLEQMKIRIEIGEEVFAATLTMEFSPKTVEAIVEALPIESEALEWGDEIYFDIPVDMGEENAKELVSKGDIGYWPAGNALCLFYGKTPISESEEKIKPASAVNIVGKIEGPDKLKKVKHKEGEKIRIYQSGDAQCTNLQ